jgi:hypothetical protein
VAVNGALALLTWFFHGWAHRPGPAKARERLGRWLRAPRSRIFSTSTVTCPMSRDADPYKVDERIPAAIMASTLSAPTDRIPKGVS